MLACDDKDYSLAKHSLKQPKTECSFYNLKYFKLFIVYILAERRKPKL